MLRQESRKISDFSHFAHRYARTLTGTHAPRCTTSSPYGGRCSQVNLPWRGSKTDSFLDEERDQDSGGTRGLGP